MPDTASLETRLLQLFTQQMNLEVNDAGLDLIEEGILDSLTFVDLLFRLEKEFNIKVAIDSVEADQFRTVRKIATFVKTKSTP